MSVSNPTLITFVIYIAAMVLIGLMAYRSTNNLSDYILGGRSLGSVVTALSAGASDMSGWLLMGLPGAIYMSVCRRPSACADRAQRRCPDSAGLFFQPFRR
jgi:sodium/proline symporter